MATTTIFYTLDGVTRTIPEWAAELNIPAVTLYRRAKKGCSAEKFKSIYRNDRKFITYNGETKTRKEWASFYGLDAAFISRLKRGWSIDEAMQTPQGQSPNKIPGKFGKLFDHQGKSFNYGGWGEELGGSHYTVSARLKRGWDLEKALDTPLSTRGRKKNSQAKTYSYNGITKSARGWADNFGVSPNVFYSRLAKGMTFEQIMSDLENNRIKIKSRQ